MSLNPNLELFSNFGKCILDNASTFVVHKLATLMSLAPEELTPSAIVDAYSVPNVCVDPAGTDAKHKCLVIYIFLNRQSHGFFWSSSR